MKERNWPFKLTFKTEMVRNRILQEKPQLKESTAYWWVFLDHDRMRTEQQLRDRTQTKGARKRDKGRVTREQPKLSGAVCANTHRTTIRTSTAKHTPHTLNPHTPHSQPLPHNMQQNPVAPCQDPHSPQIP